jgi:hypothetical protein
MVEVKEKEFNDFVLHYLPLKPLHAPPKIKFGMERGSF